MSFILMPWAGHIYISEGTLNTREKRVRKRKKKTNQWIESGFAISQSSKGLLVINTFVFFL